jgi:hypothetical protein
MPFRTIPWKRNQLRSSIKVLNVYGDQKSIPRNEFLPPDYVAWRAAITIFLLVSYPHRLFKNSSSEQNAAAEYFNNSVRRDYTFDVQPNHFVKLFSCCFVKLIFSAEFHSVPFRSELRNWLFRGTRNASD